MDDIGGAAQMLQVSIQGMTLAGRATVETAKMLQRLLLLSASFFKFTAKLPLKGRKYLKYKKTKGKTNIDNLKQKGGTLEMAAFSEEGYAMFKKMAKKWGLLFHENPVFGKENREAVYVSYPAEQAPVMEKILEAMKNTKRKEYQETAEQKADELEIKGKEKKEFISASIQENLQKFQNGNYKAELEEYCLTSGIGGCSNDEFEAVMKECYGDVYEEVIEESQQGFKKKNFDSAVDELSVWRENAEPVYLCERNQPDSYIRVSWEKHSAEESENGREYLASEFEVYHEGEKQKCEEFKHGRFSHYSWKNGSQSSEKGEEHWSNIKEEMKRKGGFSDEVLIFQTKKEYLDYKKQCGENKEKKEEVLKNSRIEERNQRVAKGDAIFVFSEKDIVDVDKEEGKLKVATGIREDGKNYFLWINQKDVYHKEGKQFEMLFNDIDNITLTGISGNQKISMPAMQFLKKTGGFEEHLQRWSEYIEGQLEEIYNPNEFDSDISKNSNMSGRQKAESGNKTKTKAEEVSEHKPAVKR